MCSLSHVRAKLKRNCQGICARDFCTPLDHLCNLRKFKMSSYKNEDFDLMRAVSLKPNRCFLYDYAHIYIWL